MAVSEVADVTVSVDEARHANDVQEAVTAGIAALAGCVRVTIEGELAPGVSLDLNELQRLGPHLDGLQVRAGRIGPATTWRPSRPRQRSAGNSCATRWELAVEAQRKVVITGLHALEGRGDLEVA